MNHIMDQLAKRISELKNPTVAGLDTRIEYLPEKFVQAILPEGIRSFEDAAEAVYQYNVRLVDALCDIVPAVKVQVAYYEMYGVAGMAAFEKTMAYAKSKGMIVMADVKRNDIGATAACYANAYVGRTPMPYGEEKAFSADIATINPYLGVDGIKPFTEACAANGTGVFALVKTSNPSSGQLQDLRQNMLLLRQHGDLIHPLADVQVTDMQKFQHPSPQWITVYHLFTISAIRKLR